MHQTIIRFAPSPTGLMHLGNARTAIICWLHAKKNKGKFILRIDDTDKERCSSQYEESIYKDLKWLGLDWDLTEKQTEHQTIFSRFIIQLKNKGFLYPCYETKEELDTKKKLQLKSGMPPIYDRSALKITKDEILENEKKGKNPCWRFKISYDKAITWNDLVRDNIIFDPKKISDPIVIRSDGSYTYLLISVISDIHHQITDIIRGEDHITNTAIQIQMFEALNYKIPKLGHLSLLKIEEGKISKRNGKGDYSISTIKENNIDSMAIVSYLASIGSSCHHFYYKSMNDIIKNFNIKKYSNSTAKISIDEIEKINSKILQNLTYQEISEKITTNKSKINPTTWNTIKANVNTIKDVEEWLSIIQSKINQKLNITESQKEILKIAIKKLPNEWDDNNLISKETTQQWIKNIENASNTKGKEIFLPIRISLTGKTSGPEIFKILSILGKNEVINRMTNAYK